MNIHYITLWPAASYSQAILRFLQTGFRGLGKESLKRHELKKHEIIWGAGHMCSLEVQAVCNSKHNEKMGSNDKHVLKSH